MNPDGRDLLNAHPAKRISGEPADESEHFYICKVCGQAVDKRRLGDVFHHEGAGHAPLGSGAY